MPKPPPLRWEKENHNDPLPLIIIAMFFIFVIIAVNTGFKSNNNTIIVLPTNPVISP